MQADSEYIGPDWKHVLIKPGDIIIVYAYINKVTAVGFNTRTNLGGKFPIATSKKVEPQPYVEPEILISIKSGGVEGPSSLSYERGQYIRVCRWVEGCEAYGFNQSTFSMGRVYIVDTGFTKVEWHTET